jgi:CHRD domain-containing protein
MRQTYNRRSILGYGTAGAALLLALPSRSQAATTQFKADLQPSSEVPPNSTTGSGSVTATFDPGTKVLTWNGTYSGTSGAVTAAHIHGPAAAGQNAGVVFWISQKAPGPGEPAPPFPSPFSGSATLSDAQASDLMAGLYYVNIHTKANPGGELRGQLVKS